MRKKNFDLNKLIDLKKWNYLQESLAAVTRMAIIIVDYKGNPVTKHSRCQKFCNEIRSDSQIAKYCQKCDSRGGFEAVRSGKPYIYLCHYNIVDIAIPIMIEGKYIGAVMAGQVKLSDANENILEQIVVLTENSIANKALDNFRKYYYELPVLTYDEVSKIADMLFYLCDYMVEEALEKSLISDMYNMIVNNQDEGESNLLEGYTIKNIENVKKEMSNAIIDAYVKENVLTYGKMLKVSDTLKPAIEYIYKHKSENLKLEDCSKLCHISSSYFSRLFVKETGESFSTYTSKLKVKWAKSLLEETDMQVNEISNELGFNEVGYFIKIFKKYEGVTPFLYRKYCKKK